MTFTDFTQTVANVYENLQDYNPTKKKKVLIVFDDMIGDMEDNRNLSLIEDDEDNDELFLWYG